MNERIKELEKQCWTHRVDGTLVDGQLHFDTKKFTQLIVRECIDCLKPLSRNHSMVGAAQDTIKEHFGVEE